jgi:hypothetical protein
MALPRKRYRLNAKAAAAENARIASTDTPVVITLLSAYWPMLPTSHAIAHCEKSMLVGRENGSRKICELVLKLESTIQTSGKKNTAATAMSAIVMAAREMRRLIPSPPPVAGA